jgi:DNA-directed RNA polymerase beta subunit
LEPSVVHDGKTAPIGLVGQVRSEVFVTMAQTHSGHKRIRKFYGKIREVAEMPNLIEVQKSSYDLFLNSGDGDIPQDGEGLKGTFQSVFPIKDFNETATLEFVKYELEAPKYDVDECMQRDMTYAAPLKVTLRLIVFEVDEETGARSVKDIKEQDVYMGDMPLMTPNGTFVVNGTERVIVSQMHRSPGVFFDHDKGKTHSSGKLLFTSRIIPTAVLARLRVRRQGHRLRPHRPAPETAGDDAALRAGARPGGHLRRLLRHRDLPQGDGRLGHALLPGAAARRQAHP